MTTINFTQINGRLAVSTGKGENQEAIGKHNGIAIAKNGELNTVTMKVNGEDVEVNASSLSKFVSALEQATGLPKELIRFGKTPTERTARVELLAKQAFSDFRSAGDDFVDIMEEAATTIQAAFRNGAPGRKIKRIDDAFKKIAENAKIGKTFRDTDPNGTGAKKAAINAAKEAVTIRFIDSHNKAANANEAKEAKEAAIEAISTMFEREETPAVVVAKEAPVVVEKAAAPSFLQRVGGLASSILSTLADMNDFESDDV